jgi:hypothetical protein
MTEFPNSACFLVTWGERPKALFPGYTVPRGPWDLEPSRVEWRAHGFPCLIRRIDLGSLCGYVAVPEGHPWHGENHDLLSVEVHGGLTFSGFAEDWRLRLSCVADPWWLGFDCAHAFDRIPSLDLPSIGFVYRDVHYVARQVVGLALQAREAAERSPS